MMRVDADVAILGAGFAGSLLALVLQRIGRRVILIERGTHPRFALGESSTPLANLTLEEISRTYDLPRLAPLAKYGTWKQTYPNLVRGRKRGFTFVSHPTDQPFISCPQHTNELLVTANPTDDLADTHWLRSDVDHFLVQEVVAANIPYLDRTHIHTLQQGAPWRLSGQREGEGVEISAAFLVDATGAASILAKTLHIDTSPENMRTNSWSVFNHFTEVERWQDVLLLLGGRPQDHPYPCDDAALHHVFEDGWMWVLRFDNGVTSAGFLINGEKHPPDSARPPQEQWQRWLSRYPAVAYQFCHAKPILPWTVTRRLQRRARLTAGDNWAMLPSAAYTLDALYSTGNAHSLLALRRLARIIEREWGRDMCDALAGYDQTLQREISFLDMLVHGSYQAFRSFRLLAAWTMYYFAGAISSEERRRQGRASETEEFLSSHIPDFRASSERSYSTLLGLCEQKAPDLQAFERQVATDIAPWNTVGLCDPAKRNLYPY